MNGKPWISSFRGKTPQISEGVFVDVSARLIGDVRLAEGVSVWPMAVLRADSASIVVGWHSAILDQALVEAPEGEPVKLGEESIVSHCAAIHGACIESRVLVGIGAIILDGAVVSSGSIVGAGSIVTPGTRIPENSLVLGSPGKVVRETTQHERRSILDQIEELRLKSGDMTSNAAKEPPH